MSDLLRITIAISAREFLHQAIYLLRLAWQPEAFQEASQCGHEIQSSEVKQVNESVHHFFVRSVFIIKMHDSGCCYCQCSFQTRKTCESAKTCPADSQFKFNNAQKSPAVFGNFFQLVKIFAICYKNFQPTENSE